MSGIEGVEKNPAEEKKWRVAEESFSTPATRVAVAAITENDLRRVLTDPRTKKQFPLEQLQDAREILLRQRHALDLLDEVMRGKGNEPVMMSEYVKVIIDNGRNIPEDVRGVLAAQFGKEAFPRIGWVSWREYDWTRSVNHGYRISIDEQLKALKLLGNLKNGYDQVIDEYDRALGTKRDEHLSEEAA